MLCTKAKVEQEQIVEMVWVGSFESLQSVLRRPRFVDAPLKIQTWVPTKLDLISPLADWLMNLITAARCVQRNEDFVELALREALSNAMIHGNRLEASKLVHVHCCCDCTGVSVIVSDQGQGFDPSRLPDPLAVENLSAEHGRGIHLMKLAMDEVSFERGGAVVHMRRKRDRERRSCASALRVMTP